MAVVELARRHGIFSNGACGATSEVLALVLVLVAAGRVREDELPLLTAWSGAIPPPLAMDSRATAGPPARG